MDIRAEMTYPGASVEDVWGLVVDRDFRGEVCEATHALAYEVRVARGDDGSATVTVERTMPAEVPDFVKRFVGDTVEVVQAETWGPPTERGDRTARLETTLVGQPATLQGTMTLNQRDGAVTQTITGTLTVKIPLVGRKIESEVARGIYAAARTEEACGNRRLAGT